MNTITANDLKTKGISCITGKETLITVHGKTQYVVLDIDLYERFREAELEVAVLQAKRDIENGDFIHESVRDHIKRISK